MVCNVSFILFSVAPFLSMKERAMHDKVNEIPGELNTNSKIYE